MSDSSSHWEPIEEPGDIICTYGEHRGDVPAVAILSTAEGTWDGSAACEYHIDNRKGF